MPRDGCGGSGIAVTLNVDFGTEPEYVWARFTPVPEPAGLLLLRLGGLNAVRRR